MGQASGHVHKVYPSNAIIIVGDSCSMRINNEGVATTRDGNGVNRRSSFLTQRRCEAGSKSKKPYISRLQRCLLALYSLNLLRHRSSPHLPRDSEPRLGDTDIIPMQSNSASTAHQVPGFIYIRLTFVGPVIFPTHNQPRSGTLQSLLVED
jgi:hypothetical protein